VHNTTNREPNEIFSLTECDRKHGRRSEWLTADEWPQAAMSAAFFPPP
jgi:hypothetical protein